MSDQPHNFEWPQYVIDRVMAKRGRLNVYERFARGETTARDAMMLDYRVTKVSDANAARYDEDHAAGLTLFYQSFGDVRTTGDVLNNVIEATPVK